MITLNQEELISLNSMIDNEPIYGLRLVDKELPEETRMENVIDSLGTKEILMNGELSDKGFILARWLLDYKKCKTHVFINTLRVALVDDEHVVVIQIEQKDHYKISRLHKVEFAKHIVTSAPFLMRESKKRFLPYTAYYMTQEELEEELDDLRWTEILLIQKHENQHVLEHVLYYMSEQVGYCYKYLEKEKIQKEPNDIRIELMKILEIGGV